MATSLYGASEAQDVICVFLEREGDTLQRVSLELLSRGRELADEVGWKLAGLLLGYYRMLPLMGQAFEVGADEIWVAEHPLLKTFTVEAYTSAAFQVIMNRKPSIFLCGATPNGRDLAGRLAVKLRTGLTADCTDLRMREGGILVGEVTGFGGGVLALIETPQHRPQMATVRPGVFPLKPPRTERVSRAVEIISVTLDEAQVRTRVVEQVVGRGADITQSPVVVVGGRGIQGRFDLLRQLAELLGGEVGATRPPVDSGQIERERQVGQTGVVCRPKVAIVCGASGAFQFTVGIQHADTVIAINTDPEAPIFETADYGVVGDALQIVPALIEALRNSRVAVTSG